MIFTLNNLYVLGAWILLSLLSIKILPLLSLTLWIISGWFLLKSKPNSDSLIGITLSAIFSLFILFWFRDLLVAPSNDDTINHLYYLQSLLENQTCLIGNSNKPGIEWFGEAKNHFYPSGSHALIALWYYPFKFFGIKAYQFLQWSLMAILMIWPWQLWQGSKLLLPAKSTWLRLFLVISTITLPVFPLWPLGEGGISRIFAMVLFTPLWFQALSGNINGFLWTAVFAPILLFIHPSLIAFIGLAVIFFNKRNILLAIAGSIPGAILFYLIMKSGHQEIFAFNTLPEFNGWFDRLKGPFHFWFSDPYGFGKFLSLKNIAIYAGLFLVFRKKTEPRILFLFLTPFILISLTFVQHPLIQQIGLIYYHSAKRVSELTPLLGITIACFACHALISDDKKMKYPTLILGAIFMTLFFKNSINSLENYHSLYHSPKKAFFNGIAEQLNHLPKTVIIINDDHEYDSLKYMLDVPVFNKWSECSKFEVETQYCMNRNSFVTDIQNKEKKNMVSGKAIWWIPESNQQSINSLNSITIDGQRKMYRIL